jgi:hypothetical protein
VDTLPTLINPLAVQYELNVTLTYHRTATDNTANHTAFLGPKAELLTTHYAFQTTLTALTQAAPTLESIDPKTRRRILDELLSNLHCSHHWLLALFD